ncbi:hypothetical protein CEUSTIGMA_g2978.t1 [Chlamydomonas eustigma]|uniref:Uncharacterized protein n=1 Tax=Chlamydomonas eustigma TaxID=1157962 RepID=A0A250WXM7_9CHLO|nr:hypothetical protein CEUSTIGMA_g2978.t1 [Chlamydomonas eustigma]|eukprot:GAX75535.1 hypothetical protein CEUSTIGMA_g2978.t1 [Chlamydomonas eustigma]
MSIARPPERHIPVQFRDIYGIVKGSLSIGQRQLFEEICQLLESLFAQEFMNIRRRLKQNFLPFSAGAKGQRLQARLGRPVPNKLDLDQREINLVADFMQILASARYHLMTSEEWIMAVEESFTFNMPIQVNWAFFDTKLLTSFWSSSAERRLIRQLLPDSSDHCLVFHRGIDVAKASGLYINDKIELLLSYAVFAPLIKLWNRMKVLRLGLFKWHRTTVSPSEGLEADLQASSSKTPLQHRHAKMGERMSLRTQLPSIFSVLSNFLKVIHIKEPVFKEVVVMYRVLQKHKTTSKVLSKKRSNDDRIADILRARNIHMRCFHDIPMADLDLVFPEKKVSLKLVSLLTMVVSAVTALIAVASMMFNAHGKINISVVFSALSLIAARCFQVYSSMQAERSQTIQDMTNVLYNKTNDAQEGVISMLLEDMADQRLKEAVLAYANLYLFGSESGTTIQLGGKGATLSELDVECENFLEEHFGVKLDFALEDTLPILLEWGLVRQRHNRLKGTEYVACSLEEAHDHLTKRWSSAYETIGRPQKDKELPLTSLLPNPKIALSTIQMRRMPGKIEDRLTFQCPSSDVTVHGALSSSKGSGDQVVKEQDQNKARFLAVDAKVANKHLRKDVEIKCTAESPKKTKNPSFLRKMFR